MMERREGYNHLDGIKEDIAEIKSNIQLLVISIHGNTEPGLKTRVDRVESGMTIISKVVWIVITLLLSAIISKIAGAW